VRSVKPQLFYLIADPDGAAARRYVTEHDLKALVDFRNVHYDEVRADLEAHHARAGREGPPRLPALWDGEVLHEGLDATLAALARVRP
jgi:hypothetical protein